MRAIFTIILLLLLVGCANMQPQQLAMVDDQYQKLQEEGQQDDRPSVKINKTGSIYRASDSVPLFEDIKAGNVGDILTIVLTEQTTASKKASTSTSKQNDVSTANPTLFGTPANLGLPRMLGGGAFTLENSLSSDKSFTGEGDRARISKILCSAT